MSGRLAGAMLALLGGRKRANAAISLQAGSKVAQVCELLMEVLRRTEAEHVLDPEVLERGGAGDGEDELCSEAVVLMQQSDELESMLKAIIPLSTAGATKYSVRVPCSLSL